MKTLWALLLLVVAGGCCDCGGGNCCGNACPAPGAVAPYAAQRPVTPAGDAASKSTQVAKAGNTSTTASRQVEYYDGNQAATFLR